jgi:hypothetical protein
MSACSRCSEIAHLETHHIYPQCHFGKTQQGNRVGIKLCQRCHDHFEDMLCIIESVVSGQEYGRRYKLRKEYYEKATRLFLRQSKIVYLAG